MHHTTKGLRVDSLSAPDEKGCRTGIVIWEDMTGLRATQAVFAADGVCISHLGADWRLQVDSDNVVYLGQRPERRVMVEDVAPPYYSEDSFTATFLRLFNEFLEEQIPPEVQPDCYRDLLHAFYTPLVWKDYSSSKRRFLRKVVVNAAVKAAIMLLPQDRSDEE